VQGSQVARQTIRHSVATAVRRRLLHTSGCHRVLPASDGVVFGDAVRRTGVARISAIHRVPPIRADSSQGPAQRSFSGSPVLRPPFLPAGHDAGHDAPCRIFSLTVASFFKNCGENFH